MRRNVRFTEQDFREQEEVNDFNERVIERTNMTRRNVFVEQDSSDEEEEVNQFNTRGVITT